MPRSMGVKLLSKNMPSSMAVSYTHLDVYKRQTPLFGNHWALGLEGNYVATLAAKQRDPRVDTRFYTLELTPGITYSC